MSPRALAARLAAMYFLQYSLFAAQGILLAGHMRDLGFSGVQIGYVYGTGSLAAIVSPVLAGWLADHVLPTQRLAGACYLTCAPILAWAWRQDSFPGLWMALCLFQLLHAPTMALTNVIALHHLPDPRRIGHVRAWGTVGWVAMSWCLSLYLTQWEAHAPGASHLGDGLVVAALLAVVTGLYCVSLPHTPPGGGGPRRGAALLDGFRLLARSRPFAVLSAVSVILAATGPFFYNLGFLFFTDPHGVGLSSSAATAVMSIGQVAEIAVMLALAASLRVLGTRWTIFLGALAMGLRFAAFALGEPKGLVIAAQTLHGVGFTCFAMGSLVAVEALAPRSQRASAQALLVFAGSGVGALIGHGLSGRAYDHYALTAGGHDWTGIFLWPAVAAVGAAVVLLVLYREEGEDVTRSCRPGRASDAGRGRSAERTRP